MLCYNKKSKNDFAARARAGAFSSGRRLCPTGERNGMHRACRESGVCAVPGQCAMSVLARWGVIVRRRRNAERGISLPPDAAPESGSLISPGRRRCPIAGRTEHSAACPGVRRVRADRAVYEARFAAMLPAYSERYAGEALRIAAGLTRMSARGLFFTDFVRLGCFTDVRSGVQEHAYSLCRAALARSARVISVLPVVCAYAGISGLSVRFGFGAFRSALLCCAIYINRKKGAAQTAGERHGTGYIRHRGIRKYPAAPDHRRNQGD